MKNITFDKEAKSVHIKEDIEWLRIWCEDVNIENMPRVALIGDSITEGYYQFVKNALKEVAKVDYLTTSYSIASDMYQSIVKNFVTDSKYDVVHFNYGLHAFSADTEVYESRCKELLQFISQRSKTVVATTTTVLEETLEKENLSWKEKVIERNEKIIGIAQELDLQVDDLNKVCKEFGLTERYKDGVHFADEGYVKLAESVVLNVKKQLN